MEITWVSTVLLSLWVDGFWMSTVIQCERTCREGAQWAAMEIMSLQHPPERRILDQRMVGVRHVHTSRPPSHTDAHSFAWLVCAWTQKMSKTQHGARTHTHTRTQSTLCLDNLTENHHGNRTLIALWASLALYVWLFFSSYSFLSRVTQTQHLTRKDL